MDILAEMGIYAVYIYSIILFFCLTKLSYISLALIGVYTYAFTFWIYQFGNCRMYGDYLYLIILVYSAFCIFVCFQCHVMYNKYKGARWLLLLVPFGYFSAIKTMEYACHCDSFANARFMTTWLSMFNLHIDN